MEGTAGEPDAAKSRIPCSWPEINGSRRASGTQAGIEPSTTALSSTALDENASLSSSNSNNSDIISLQDFIAPEPPSYRVKRLSLAAPEHGPVLRIAKDAEKILMGTHSDGEDDAGEELVEFKGSSMPDFWTSTVIKDQLKAPKERIFPSHLPPTESTTCSSMSRLETEQNQLIAAASGFGGTRTNTVTPTVAASELDGGRLAHRVGSEDPFVADEHTGGPCLPEGQRRPLTCAEAPNSDLKTVSERSSAEEKSRIPPLATSDSQNKEPAPIRISDVSNNTNTTNNPSHRQPLGIAPGLQTPVLAQIEKSEDAEGTGSAEGHNRQPFPPRISSRKHFQEVIQGRNDRDRPVPNRQSTEAQIPNRFASTQSRNQLNVVSTPTVPFIRAGNVHRSDLNTTQNSSSSLQQRHTVDSVKAQLSATKGMLSNFRGLFHKHSLENSDARSAAGNGGPACRKKAVVSKNGSPFPFISTAVSSNPLSTGSVRAKPRLTPAPCGISSERATDSIPEFAKLESGASRRAERLALRVLDSALLETNVNKRDQLGQVSCKPRLLRCISPCH
jgi:hypothetical protein